ncbi:MAG: histidine phosphatase family protein [Aureispira sp.]
MKIYLYRHGETEHNKARLIQGRGIDSNLNATGRAQAAAFFEVYKGVPFDCLFTSELQRTQQTAAPFEALGIPVKRRAALDEISWGDWEGKSASQEMSNDYLEMLTAWGEGNYACSLANGDSALSMQQRLQPFVEELLALKYKQVLVCSHGGTLGFLLPLLLEEPLSTMPSYKHHNTGLDIFEYKEGTGTLLVQNDTTHAS